MNSGFAVGINRLCPTCSHDRHEGHQYVERGICCGCYPCLDFQRAYHLAEERWDHARLIALDADWRARRPDLINGGEWGPRPQWGQSDAFGAQF